MLKKLAILLFAVMMALAFTACGSSEPAAEEETEAATESEEPMSGGWQVVEEPEAASLPSEVQEAFDQFMENYNDELIPIAYYGKQVVAGTNYGLICKSKTDNSLQTVVLKEDPELGMDALINTFVISDYTEGEGADLSGEPEDGAWEIPYDYTGTPLPEEAQAAVDKARETYEGNSFDTITLLGTQVVAGTNYAILVCGKTDTETPVDAMQVVTVYADLEGNAEITNVCNLDLAEFNE